MYRNIESHDIPNLNLQKLNKNILSRVCLNKSYIMIKDEGIHGYILLLKQKMILNNFFPIDDVLHFLNIYEETKFKTYRFVSIYEKNDDDIIYNLFDRVLSTLDNGDFIFGVANNKQDHHIYRKLGFVKLNLRTYGYQFTL